MFLEGFIVLGTILYILYKYGTKTYDHWEKQGVNHIKACIPFLGSDGFKMFWKRETIIDSINRIYNSFPGQRFGGLFMFRTPVLLIRDPELIKTITIKDFDYFVNRNFSVDPEIDPLFGNSLVSLKDQKWRDMRSTLTPAFTSSKMKTMFVLVKKCGEQLTNHLDSVIKQQVEEKHPDGDVLTLELRSFIRRFTNDVIATTAFGIEIDSLKEPDNQFYEMGNILSNFNFWVSIKFLLFLFVPSVMKALKVKFFGRKVQDFFVNLVTDSIKIREEQNIIRPDLINILMSARKGTLKDENNEAVKKSLTDEEITSQALLFFLAGFETASNTLSFLAHELAINPDIQNQLQNEIDQVIDEDKDISHEGVMHKMKYLDMVVNEGLRKWSPGLVADRLATKRYIIPKTEDSPEVVLEKNDMVWIPTIALHRDPKFFPDPEKFNPERFSDENKNKIVPFTFVPFGSGPRNCIGMRYGLMQLKAFIVYLLHKYSLVIVPKTRIPLQLTKNQLLFFQLNVEKGFWLGIKPRISQS